MTIQRMDNVGIVVDDLDAAVAFFTELGMELEGRAQIEGPLGGPHRRARRRPERDRDDADPGRPRQAGADHVPRPRGGQRRPQDPPPNTLGLHRVMFAVDDIHDTVARLRAHGAELLGEVAQYENTFLLCYLRGPAGIIVALAEQIG